MAGITTFQARAASVARAALHGDVTAIKACRELHDLLPELGLASDNEARLAIVAVVSISDHIPPTELGPFADLGSYSAFNQRHGSLERDVRRQMSRAFSELVERFGGQATGTGRE